MKNGNRTAYWNKINKEIIKITNTSSEELFIYMTRSNNLIRKCILENLSILEQNKNDIISKIEHSVNVETDINKLKREIIEYKITAETKTLTDLIDRINNYRL